MNEKEIKVFLDGYRERKRKCIQELERALRLAESAASLQSPRYSDLPSYGAGDLKDLGDKVAPYLDLKDLVDDELGRLHEIEITINRMFWGLPVKQAAVMRQIYLCDRNYDQAAEDLLISKASVCRYHRQAIRKLANT